MRFLLSTQNSVDRQVKRLFESNVEHQRRWEQQFRAEGTRIAVECASIRADNDQLVLEVKRLRQLVKETRQMDSANRFRQAKLKRDTFKERTRLASANADQRPGNGAGPGRFDVSRTVERFQFQTSRRPRGEMTSEPRSNIRPWSGT